MLAHSAHQTAVASCISAGSTFASVISVFGNSKKVVGPGGGKDRRGGAATGCAWAPAEKRMAREEHSSLIDSCVRWQVELQVDQRWSKFKGCSSDSSVKLEVSAGGLFHKILLITFKPVELSGRMFEVSLLFGPLSLIPSHVTPPLDAPGAGRNGTAAPNTDTIGDSSILITARNDHLNFQIQLIGSTLICEWTNSIGDFHWTLCQSWSIGNCV